MFHDWDSYYLLIGSAAAALIGLMFVVATLTAGRDRTSAMRGASLYMTPTVFHFAVVVVVSAAVLAPGLPPAWDGIIVGAVAWIGLVYAVVVTTRMLRGETTEVPHWTDVWCYGAVPAAIYLGLATTAVTIWSAPEFAPYGVAVTLIVLLLMGIRNAWDLVTWLAPGKAADSVTP